MRSQLVALLFLAATSANAAGPGAKDLLGEWEAARAPDGDRLLVRLMEKGRAEVVAEYNFQLPGEIAMRRGRSTTFATWKLRGRELTLAYSKVRDRLHYSQRLPLSVIGMEGTAPALEPVGMPDAKSRLGSAILWRAPHEYRLKAPEAAADGTTNNR